MSPLRLGPIPASVTRGSTEFTSCISSSVSLSSKSIDIISESDSSLAQFAIIVSFSLSDIGPNFFRSRESALRSSPLSSSRNMLAVLSSTISSAHCSASSPRVIKADSSME